jgi:Flp pilus assembly protein CpaB
MENNRLLLIIAVLAGVFATGLAFTYINQATSNTGPVTEAGEQILVVVNDLPANHQLDPDRDLRVESVPARTFAGFAKLLFKVDQRESLRGERLGTPVAAGSPLLYSHMKMIQDTNLAPGSRALGIRVKGENLMGGLLVPGDRVDIIATYKIPRAAAAPSSSGNAAFNPNDPSSALGTIFSQLTDTSAYPDEFQSQEVLSNVRIVGVGASLGASRQQFMFDQSGSGGGGGGDRIITLEVTPEQAVELIRADAASKNNLTLLLRPNTRLPSGSTAVGDGG